jgi:hypothetical protein
LLDAERSLGGVDLVHTLTHELGHVIGFEHHHADQHAVMAASLAPTLPSGSSGVTPLLNLPVFSDSLSLGTDLQAVSISDDGGEPASVFDTMFSDANMLVAETPGTEVQDDFWAGFGVEDRQDDESDEEDLLGLLAHRIVEATTPGA